jgi:hypothetical protein
MTKQRQSPAPVGPARSDDDLAKAIVAALSIEGTSAVHHVKSRIGCLRKSVPAAARRAQPNKTNKTIKEIAEHARALAAGIDALDPGWRWFLALSAFQERSPAGAVLAGCDDAHKATVRMEEWIRDLKRLPDNFGQMKASSVILDRGKPRRSDFFSRPKTLCAFEAREIILALSPTTKLTKGDSSKFYLIASLLWEAATGEPDEDMKRACDDCIDLFAGIAAATAEQEKATSRQRLIS